MTLKKKELEKAAADICETCGLEAEDGGPAIKVTKKTKPKEIEKKIKEAFEFIEEDEYSELDDETKEVLTELGYEAGDAEEAEDDDSEDDDSEDDDSEDDDSEDDDSEEETDLATLVNETKKLADLKELVKEHDVFKKLRKGLPKYKGLSGPRELKPKMLEALGVEPDEPKETKKAGKKAGKKAEKKASPIVKKEAGNTRYGACALALQELNGKTVSMAEIAEKADELYQEVADVEANVKQSKRVLARFIPFAVVLGLLKEDGKKFKVSV